MELKRLLEVEFGEVTLGWVARIGSAGSPREERGEKVEGVEVYTGQDYVFPMKREKKGSRYYDRLREEQKHGK